MRALISTKKNLVTTPFYKKNPLIINFQYIVPGNDKLINFRISAKQKAKQNTKSEKEGKKIIKTHLDSSANFPASLGLKNKDTTNEHSMQNETLKNVNG